MSEDLWIESQSDDLSGPQRAPRRPRAAVDTSRHLGCPLWWFRLVFPVVGGKNELAVALYLYRLRIVHHSRTVTVTNERLFAELGINRFAKRRALRRLAAAGIVILRRRGQEAVEVVFRR
jgi:hypothetical protein